MALIIKIFGNKKGVPSILSHLEGTPHSARTENCSSIIVLLILLACKGGGRYWQSLTSY